MNKNADKSLEQVKKLLSENFIHKLTYKRNWTKSKDKERIKIFDLFIDKKI